MGRRVEKELLPWTAGFTPARVDVPTLTRYVWRLAEDHQLYLAEHPEILPLYASGIRFEPEWNEQIELRWWTPNYILANGASDCKGLAAWRLGELWLGRRVPQDARAMPLVELVQVDAFGRPKLFHVRVVRGNGDIEDPSVKLGLRGVG